MPVVAAALQARDGRWLLQQRPAGKPHAGLWEFPGGKVKGTETPRAALVRELVEELDIGLAEGELHPAGFAEGVGGDGMRPIVLFLYTCRCETLVWTATEGQQVGLFTREEAALLALAPMDRHLLEFLA